MNVGKIAQNYVGRKVFVGIDVHLRSYAVSVVVDGAVIDKWVTPAEPIGFGEQLKVKYCGANICSGYEAGFSGFVLHRELEKAGIQNVVVHAGAVAVSSGDRVKTDRRDAEKLARQLAGGMLKGIRIPTEQEEQKRQLTRVRQQLVKDRSRVMIQIRRRLVHFGYLTDYQGVLRRSAIESTLGGLQDCELKWSVQAHCNVWTSLDAEIRGLEKRLKAQAAACPYEAVYRQAPGIGIISARILANELGDMSQFLTEKSIFCYVGLTPTEHSSGERVRRGHISRQGKSILRKILVECAWVAIRKDQTLRTYYYKLAHRVGPKRAIVAVARKLIGHIRAMFRKGEQYRETLDKTAKLAA